MITLSRRLILVLIIGACLTLIVGVVIQAYYIVPHREKEERVAACKQLREAQLPDLNMVSKDIAVELLKLDAQRYAVLAEKCSD